MSFIILLRGGGDLASGVALRLHRAGLRVAISELPRPLAVRRLVSFAEAAFSGETVVEGITARRVTDPTDTLRILRVFAQGQIPLLIDPEGEAVRSLRPTVLVDARMMKQPLDTARHNATLVIGLGPGFSAGQNCHAVVETNRGHCLGRVLWEGAAEPDTGIPDSVRGQNASRVLRAPASGEVIAHVEIGQQVQTGQLLAEVEGQPLLAPFEGVLRGLIHPGMQVSQGLKIGDIDPRNDPLLCSLVSDKALAVGGGVLEAILSRRELRSQLWT
jgi:xanthine dehydrogenase accessory factor